MTQAKEEGLALVFPGQGAQFVGMGGRLLKDSTNAKILLQAADDILGMPLSRIIQDGPEDVLNDTTVTQPAILAITVALWQEVEAQLGGRPSVTCVAGHSLGEFSALTVAGALDYEDAIRLVRRRGQAMAEAGQSAPGGMGVILGLDDEDVQAIVDEVHGRDPGVWVANLNCPGQVVISGRQEPLKAALSLAEKRGAKRAMPLAVSVASHTPLMEDATQALSEALKDVALQEPWAPVVCNAWAQPIQSPDDIRQALLEQLTHPVQWTQSVQRMQEMGVRTMLEIGPKAVLGGLIRRIARDVQRLAVTDLEEAEALQPLELSA
ncbi:MAG: ACP S-malonyltransferase [Anaerolineae bacterium]